MDIDWCVAELDAYARDLAEHEWLMGRPPNNSWSELRQLADEIVVRLPVIKEIVKRVQPEKVATLELGRFESGELQIDKDARDVVLTTKTLLKRRAEIEVMLASPSPKLAADQLHRWVWDAAQTLWETKHYRAAVQAAATNVNAHVQSLVGRRDVSDLKLMSECFSDKDPEPGKPRFRWPGDPTDEGVKSMNSGMRLFGQGVFAAVRNPATHTLDELTEHQALERLAAFSLLCHLIDGCTFVESN